MSTFGHFDIQGLPLFLLTQVYANFSSSILRAHDLVLLLFTKSQSSSIAKASKFTARILKEKLPCQKGCLLWVSKQSQWYLKFSFWPTILTSFMMSLTIMSRCIWLCILTIFIMWFKTIMDRGYYRYVEIISLGTKMIVLKLDILKYRLSVNHSPTTHCK